MAKVTFTKLGLKRNDAIQEINWNGQKIEIKQFLPTGKKLDLISRVINYSTDENAFYNPCKVEIFETIEIILTYTNITVTEKQSEDVLNLYDLFISSGLKKIIYENIPEEERNYINVSVWATINEIYRYRDSALGILDAVNQDYSNLNLEADNIQQKLADPENLTLLKDVITKLG